MATAILSKASSGMTSIAVGSLSAESRLDGEGKLVDVFCVSALREDGAAGPSQYCLQVSSRGVTQAPASTGETDTVSFVQAKTLDEKDYQRKKNAITLTQNGKTYKLGIDTGNSKEDTLRVTTCNNRWIIAQSSKRDSVTTVLFDMSTNEQKTLTDAPLVNNGSYARKLVTA